MFTTTWSHVMAATMRHAHHECKDVFDKLLYVKPNQRVAFVLGHLKARRVAALANKHNGHALATPATNTIRHADNTGAANANRLWCAVPPFHDRQLPLVPGGDMCPHTWGT